MHSVLRSRWWCVLLIVGLVFGTEMMIGGCSEDVSVSSPEPDKVGPPNGFKVGTIVLEPNSDSTAYSAAAVAEIMRRMNLNTCIVVSDGYHVFRAKKLLEDQGLKAYGSPRPEQPRNDWAHWKLCARQAAGYLLWRVGIRV